METTVEEILNWIDRSGVSRKELASKMDMHYNSLCSILNGNAPLSKKRANVIARIMREHDEQTRAKLPPEVERKINAWAKMMHEQIDVVVDLVLAYTLRETIAKMEKQEEATKEEK